MSYAVETRDLTRIFAGKKKRRRKAEEEVDESVGPVTALENIWMFSQFYGVPSKVSKGRIDELMHIFGLWDKRNAKVRMLSTGQRQKMNMIRGFVTDPDILFLDEPTLGLDVNAARVICESVTNRAPGPKVKPVRLTTHY